MHPVYMRQQKHKLQFQAYSSNTSVCEERVTRNQSRKTMNEEESTYAMNVFYPLNNRTDDSWQGQQKLIVIFSLYLIILP